MSEKENAAVSKIEEYQGSSANELRKRFNQALKGRLEDAITLGEVKMSGEFPKIDDLATDGRLLLVRAMTASMLVNSRDKASEKPVRIIFKSKSNEPHAELIRFGTTMVGVIYDHENSGGVSFEANLPSKHGAIVKRIANAYQAIYKLRAEGNMTDYRVTAGADDFMQIVSTAQSELPVSGKDCAKVQKTFVEDLYLLATACERAANKMADVTVTGAHEIYELVESQINALLNDLGNLLPEQLSQITSSSLISPVSEMRNIKDIYNRLFNAKQLYCQALNIKRNSR